MTPYDFDDKESDNSPLDNADESRLIKKFNDYTKLEKYASKKKFLELSNEKKPGTWTNRFIISSILQGSIITGITLSLLIFQGFVPEINLIEFILSFDGPVKFFFFGYIMYMVLVVIIAITGMFYNHLEVNLGKQISGNNSIFVWIHLIGINVGGAAATISMIFAGLVGSGLINFISSGGNDIISNIPLMNFVLSFQTSFIAIIVIGFVAGVYSYLRTYLKKDVLDLI